MAFCMWKIHSSLGKPASKLILPNCNLSRNVLRDVPEASESLRWSTYSALFSRSVTGSTDKKNPGNGQLTTLQTPEGWSANSNHQEKFQLQSIRKDSNSLGTLSVNLSELYARDPLAILLHSRLPIYNSFPDQQDEETCKAKSLGRTSRHEELSACHPHLHDAVANQQTISTASSIGEDCVIAPSSPAYREAIVSSCTLGSVVAPPSPALLAGSALQPSLHQYAQPLPQPGGAGQGRGQAPGVGGGNVNPRGLPSPEQLQRTHDALLKCLNNTFAGGSYYVYDKNVIFENRIRGTVTKGIAMYAMQMTLLTTIARLKFAHVRLDIIKITQHPEEGTIKVRWRIKGVKSRSGIAGFYRASKWSPSEVVENSVAPNWYDGFSTFHVSSVGLVTRHVADNMMPDDDKRSLVQKTGLFARLAVLFGLVPKAGHGNAMVGG